MDPVLQKLETTISRERLGRYLSATKGNLPSALKLYELNLRLSQLLYGALHGFEVLLRNSMHDQLVAFFKDPEWYEKAPLNPSSRDMVYVAKSNVGPKSYTPGKVVAELTMGFWTGLTAGSYQRDLWVPCLHKAFPNIPPDRAKIHAAISDLKALRNRVAHHERILGAQGKLYVGKHPVLGNELCISPELVTDAAGWICNDTASWIRQATQFDVCVRLLASDLAKNLRI